MKIIKNNQYGFGLIESFLLTLLILVIGFGIYKVFNNQMNKSNDSAALTRTKSDTPSLDNSSSNQITSGEILNTKVLEDLQIIYIYVKLMMTLHM